MGVEGGDSPFHGTRRGGVNLKKKPISRLSLVADSLRELHRLFRFDHGFRGEDLTIRNGEGKCKDGSGGPRRRDPARRRLAKGRP